MENNNYKEVTDELKRLDSQVAVLVHVKKDGEQYLINWFWADIFKTLPDEVKETIKKVLKDIPNHL